MIKIRKFMFYIISVMIMVSLLGCGGGSSHKKDVVNLSIKTSYDYSSAQSSEIVRLIASKQDIKTQLDSPEMYFNNTLTGRGQYIFALDATDQDGNSIAIDGSKVLWECKTAGGTLSSSSGEYVSFDTNLSGKYLVSATYNNETVEASIYFYNSNVLATSPSFPQEKVGIIFSSNTMVDNEAETDLYVKKATSPIGVILCAPEGIAIINNSGVLRNIDVDLNALNWQTEIYYNEFDLTQRFRIFIVKCKNGNYAKFTANAAQSGDRYSIYYKYITDGNFSDL
jgi:hypothetical protein